MFYKPLGKTGETISAVGQGTSIGGLSTSGGSYADMAQVIQSGIELGMTFIDTAPAYGNGQSEEIVGRTIRGVRNSVFIATKVSPESVSYDGVIQSAEASLRRLNTDYIDLYQVHWSNPTVPISETMRGMSKLAEDGKVRHIGVSNFSLKELSEATEALSGPDLVSVQDEYNLFDRGIEDHVLPYCQRRSLTLIAYSPLARGTIAGPPGVETLQRIASNHNATAAQVALRWLIGHGPVVVIPNTTNLQRVKENASSADLDLREEEIEEISRDCIVRPVPVPTQAIRVAATSDRSVYRTLEEAVQNRFNSVPSPVELAEQIKGGEFLKPVRLVPSGLAEGEYDLIEGRVRYWAWVIAYSGGNPIPALIEGSQ